VIVAPKALAASAFVTRSAAAHLHAHYGTHAALLAWMVHRLTGVPCSVTVQAHDTEVDRTMLDRKLGDAVVVIAVSEYHRELLRSTLGSDIAVKTRRTSRRQSFLTLRFAPDGTARRRSLEIEIRDSAVILTSF
jgi:hypothetical protein